MRRIRLTFAALGLLAVSGTAHAHPKLLSSAPAANASVAKPTSIKLSFSESLVGPLCGIELVMTGMPGMANHDQMPIKGFKSITNGKNLTVTLPRPLPAGTYLLKWHAVASDQHRIEGSYSFTVR